MEFTVDEVDKVREIIMSSTDNDHKKLLPILQRLGTYKTFSNETKENALATVVGLFKEWNIGIEYRNNNVLTFILPDKSIKTINIQEILNDLKPTDGFGSRTERFRGGKRTKKNIKLLQNGGEPVITGILIGIFVGGWIARCVLGYTKLFNVSKKVKEESKFYCKIPYYLGYELPKLILTGLYETARAAANEAASSNATVVPENVVPEPNADATVVPENVVLEPNADAPVISTAYATVISNDKTSETDSNADSKESMTGWTDYSKGLNRAEYLDAKNSGTLSSSNKGGKSRSKMRKRKSRRTRK